jgi:hypothetical protein
LIIDVAVPTDNNALKEERSRTFLIIDVAVPTDNNALKEERKKQNISDN